MDGASKLKYFKAEAAQGEASGRSSKESNTNGTLRLLSLKKL
jgi:hypothetical protein